MEQSDLDDDSGSEEVRREVVSASVSEYAIDAANSRRAFDA
jgi:hypothetical protein